MLSMVISDRPCDVAVDIAMLSIVISDMPGPLSSLVLLSSASRLRSRRSPGRSPSTSRCKSAEVEGGTAASSTSLMAFELLAISLRSSSRISFRSSSLSSARSFLICDSPALSFPSLERLAAESRWPFSTAICSWSDTRSLCLNFESGGKKCCRMRLIGPMLWLVAMALTIQEGRPKSTLFTAVTRVCSGPKYSIMTQENMRFIRTMPEINGFLGCWQLCQHTTSRCFVGSCPSSSEACGSLLSITNSLITMSRGSKP